ncbi:transposase [Candidatus Falkowbacteria bacterium CG10_big_fil_rev_8_21_14_0_10_43_11]|uniref:Transposase n=1 Tax=Candidatus Falkowbacteria bacterium CG10_big_fil_rev_8_21_14_0_10_43_11 TaxID=1974568 RepID=A0A2M6WLD5_9BACT|nr:MAG: transposase [Candidatus Falkowbacteria bacterium CG10_big_fil_rev_8_21_14_0_10_43_11]
MSVFKNTFRVETARHPDWDYSGDGMYFVTICTQNKFCYFGEIVNEEMRLNNIGKIAAGFWAEIPKHFPNVILDEYIIMSNHLHGIIFICNDDVRQGVDNCNRIRRDAINRVSTGGGITGQYNPMGKNSLGEIIRWYKGRVSFEVNKVYDKNFIWQSRFYDRIIRNEYELHNVRNYIYYNPVKWEIDRNNPENLFY